MLRLQCKVQHYEWGRIGADSEVARLHALSSGEGFQDLPYAELWMGTHPSGPSSVILEGGGAGGDSNPVLLQQWLDMHPEDLGKKVQQRWDGELPYLFKVLSVAKALSIQAHPDKELAKHLHASYPQIYKDGNHKPEMALALTPFEALCGFVTSEELKQAVETVPELQSVLGADKVHDLIELGKNRVNGDEAKPVLKAAFTTLMTLPKDVVTDSVSALVSRLAQEKEVRQLTEKEELVLQLEKQYPADVGVLSIFFLNYVKLVPGEAVYLDANVPHAYLSGEIVECMAASDNVVRAGFTPKFRDTQTLCAMLTYKQGLPEVLVGNSCAPFTKRYTPPFDEFEVDHIVLPVGSTTEIESAGPSILLVFNGVGAVTQGDTKKVSGVSKGDTIFLPAGKKIELAAVLESEDDARLKQPPLQLYRAGVSSHAL
ncbi:unnamed protein product [Sphagnum troendelagicum]